MHAYTCTHGLGGAQGNSTKQSKEDFFVFKEDFNFVTFSQRLENEGPLSHTVLGSEYKLNTRIEPER